ncbi:MAG: hypothetical protein HQM08_15905 [Candidatus Riflebacteria bacterium]|nr:hypothetical protein [Candidatus Riflebacteria bacterium]
MENQNKQPLSNRFLYVSQGQILAAFFLFPIGILLLMWFFFTFEFETIFSYKKIAIKVGGTRINLSEFRIIKENSGIVVKKMSEPEFASHLSEMLLFAEYARQLGLDQLPEFQEKIRQFDLAISSGTKKFEGENFTETGEENQSPELLHTIFLLEELAKAAKESIQASVSNIDSCGIKGNDNSIRRRQEMLQLRTIVVRDQEAASSVIKLSQSGISFEALNASYSVSNYTGVNGDMGLVGKDRLPEGIFELLTASKKETLIKSYQDSEGIHFFLVKDRVDQIEKFSDQIIKKNFDQSWREKALENKLSEIRKKLPVFLNPVLK